MKINFLNLTRSIAITLLLSISMPIFAATEFSAVKPNADVFFAAGKFLYNKDKILPGGAITVGNSVTDYNINQVVVDKKSQQIFVTADLMQKNKVYVYSLSNNSWKALPSLPDNNDVTSITVVGDKLYAATHNSDGIVYMYDAVLDIWTALSASIPYHSTPAILTSYNGKLISGVQRWAWGRGPYELDNGVWKMLYGGIIKYGYGLETYSFLVDHDHLYSGSEAVMIYVATANSEFQDWIMVSGARVPAEGNVAGLAIQGHTLYALSDGNVYYTDVKTYVNLDARWYELAPGKFYRNIAHIGNVTDPITGQKVVYISTQSGDIYRINEVTKQVIKTTYNPNKFYVQLPDSQ